MRRINAKRKHGRRRRATRVSLSDNFVFKGGLNLSQGVMRIKPGELIASKNYEPFFADDAYERIAGHEVFDGQPRPHLAEYWKVDLTGIAGGPYTVGETVTAVLSGDPNQTGTVASYVVNPAGDETGYLIVTDLTSNVDSGAVWTGSTSGATGTDTDGSDFQGQVDEDDHDAAQLAAELVRRGNITPVGDTACAGSVRGVHVFNNNQYAFRNNAAGTEGTMWKATSSGWTQIALGFKVIFDSGSIQPEDGDTITGATSGASCTVKRYVTSTGMWSGADATGYIITNEVVSGPFTNGENLEISGAVAMVLTSAVVAQVLPIDGAYRFRNSNFGGNVETYRMYGANGVGEAFEYDGTTFALIDTGMTNDKPSHIGVHKGHLLLGYPGGSMQHSGKNAPLNFQPVRGANELLAGDTITGFYEEIGDVTFVFTRDQTFRLEGFVQENIQLKQHNSETGAIQNTLQRIGRSIWLDDIGFTSIPTTDAFGDFASGQISVKINSLVQEFLKTLTVTGSVIHRGRSVYRCFFSNKIGIVIGFKGNKVNGITTVNYGLNITCTANGAIEEDGVNFGQERVFIGADDGYVYETDVGTNFNGAPLEAYLVLPYHFSGQAEQNKRYRRAVIYMEGVGRTTMKVSADYNYNEDAANFEEIMDRSEFLGGGRYGISRHGAFVYSATSKTDIRVPMNSHARNVSLIFYTNETNEDQSTLHSVHFHKSKRRIIRE